MKRLLAASLVAASLVSTANSQGSISPFKAKMIESQFAAADTDHDGKLTKAEVQAGMPRLAPYFDEIDKQHAGSITLAQIEEFVAQGKK